MFGTFPLDIKQLDLNHGVVMDQKLKGVFRISGCSHYRLMGFKLLVAATVAAQKSFRKLLDSSVLTPLSSRTNEGFSKVVYMLISSLGAFD